MQGILARREIRRHTREARGTIERILKRGPLPSDLKDGRVLTRMENYLPKKVFRIVASHVDGIISTHEISPSKARSLRLAVLGAVSYAISEDPSAAHPVRSKTISRNLRRIAKGEDSEGDPDCASELRGLAVTIEAARKPRHLD